MERGGSETQVPKMLLYFHIMLWHHNLSCGRDFEASREMCLTDQHSGA